MARLPYVDSEKAAPAPDANIFRLMAHAEATYRDWLRFGASVLAEMALDAVLRELAILRVAALTPGAEYEWVQHEHIARSLGMTDAQVEGARTGEGLGGDDALVARFTEQVVRDAAPDDETFAAVAERFPPREIIELLLAIGQYMMVARVMATAQIDMDPPIGSDALRQGRAVSSE
jgi:alkylhydroperoxidase family enzyme